MGVFKKGGRWWIDYSLNGRRIRRPVSDSKREADKILHKVKSDITLNKHGIPRDEKIRFADFAIKYLREHSEISNRSYKADVCKMKHLVEYFGDLDLDEITDYGWERYRKERLKERNRNSGKPISPTTINREGALLRGMLNRAVKWGYLSHNPISKMEMFREESRERILTEKEMKLLIKVARAPLKHMILIALNTGMRRGEILNLEWNRVHINPQGGGFIQVEKTKTGRMRRIPMNRSMVTLFSQLQLNRKGSQYVFPAIKPPRINDPAGEYPHGDIKSAWTALVKATGLEGVRFHDLRHTFATMALLNGTGSLVDLKETLGHTQITTTMRYAKSLFEGRQKIVDAVEVEDNQDKPLNIRKRKA